MGQVGDKDWKNQKLDYDNTEVEINMENFKSEGKNERS